MKKLCIIGCGGIGTYHLEHFLKFNDIELAGFCDLIPERAEAFVKRAGAGRAYRDYKTMYDEINPDMVFICIPPYAHGEIELETIRRKIPFFVEKPVALDIELAKKIRDEVEAAGLVTASGFQCRYSGLVEPNVKFVRENQVVSITCTRIGDIPGAEWWKDRSLSGGQIVEQTIHQFDIIRYVFGEPETVFTFGTRGFVKNVPGYATDDLTVTAIRFKNGALATISTGCFAKAGSAADNKVTFSAATARAELRILDKLELFGVSEEPAAEEAGGLVTKNDGALKPSKAGSVVIRENVDAGILCDRTFIDGAISGDGSKIRSPYADAVKSLAFTLACNKSMETGLPVNIDDMLK